MNLPQCYFADLPQETELSCALIDEAWLALQRNREEHLAGRPVHKTASDLAAAAELWLEPDSVFMKAALDLGPAQLGFSVETLNEGLRHLFSSITTPHLEAWLEQDLGHLGRLDDFTATPPERESRRRSMAVGPRTLAHITAGNLPASAVMSMVAGALVRSAQFVRCATGSSLIPRLFAHSIRQVNAPLGACIELAEWPHQRADLQQMFLRHAECVTATGSDKSLGSIHREVPLTTRFIGYGHKVSFAYLCTENISGHRGEQLLQDVAMDVAAWNQQGCLSPHVIYVEGGGPLTATNFAEQLAAALARVETSLPRGPISPKEAATIRSRRSFYEVRAAHSSETLMWQSPESTAWTVVFETDPKFQASCLNRFVYVKSVANLKEALESADPVRRQVSTVGLAAPSSCEIELTHQLADWGVRRICPVGRMQQPPALWRHDGRPALGDLITWTDWEQ